MCAKYDSLLGFITALNAACWEPGGKRTWPIELGNVVSVCQRCSVPGLQMRLDSTWFIDRKGRREQISPYHLSIELLDVEIEHAKPGDWTGPGASSWQPTWPRLDAVNAERAFRMYGPEFPSTSI